MMAWKVGAVASLFCVIGQAMICNCDFFWTSSRLLYKIPNIYMSLQAIMLDLSVL